MKIINIFTAAILLGLSCSSNAQTMEYHFSSETLNHDADRNGSPYLKFIDNEALSSGIYTLKAGQTDHQSPHDQDEIYYVMSGKSKFSVAEENFDVKAGDVIYVPAFVDHRFYDIEEDIRLLVFFSTHERKK